MERFRVELLLPLCLAICAGCAVQDQFVMPQALGIPAEQAARVVAVGDSRNVYDPKFVALFNGKGAEIRRSLLLSASGEAFTLVPGTYSISVLCKYDAVPIGLRIDVAAGQTYSIWCEPVPWSAPVIRFRNEPHAQEDAQRSPPDHTR